MNRRTLMLGATALAAAGPVAAQGASTLRVARTVGDIPLTTGQPSQGSEGNRFCGITFYDPLIAWDLSASDRAATLRPSLAESWTVGDDGKTWSFRLRAGVRFHDGSLFNAEAVAWNLGKLLDREAPQFDRQQAARHGKAHQRRAPAVADADAAERQCDRVREARVGGRCLRVCCAQRPHDQGRAAQALAGAAHWHGRCAMC